MLLNQKYHYVPNMLSALRLILGICFAVFLEQFLTCGKYSAGFLLCVFFVIWLTDVFDGLAARKLNAQSRIGAVLDVTADSVYIFSACFVFNYHGVLPVWFTFLVAIKLLEFLVTSKLSRLFDEDKGRPFHFDVFGRIASEGFFLFPGIILFFLLIKDQKLIYLFVIVLSLLSFFSMVIRISGIIKQFFKHRFRRSNFTE